MSTRATYRFLRSKRCLATIYIHHDGYPSGAAEYIKACINDYGQISVDLFLRTNTRAKITESPEIHGDTEYHYDIDIDEETVTVSKYYYNEERTERSLVVIDNDNIFMWLNAMITEDMFFEVQPKYNKPYYITMSSLQKLREQKEKELKEYEERFPDAIGNISSLKGQVEDFIDLIAQHNCLSGGAK